MDQHFNVFQNFRILSKKRMFGRGGLDVEPCLIGRNIGWDDGAMQIRFIQIDRKQKRFTRVSIERERERERETRIKNGRRKGKTNGCATVMKSHSTEGYEARRREQKRVNKINQKFYKSVGGNRANIGALGL